MLGYPIDPIIQETLNKRKKVLKRNKNPYESTGGKNPSKEIQKNIVRTPYISMFSSPKLISSYGSKDNEFDEGDIILSNQEYNRAEGEVNFNPINYGFELYTDIQKQGDKYKFKDEEQYSSQFKAKPGVKSLTSDYQSTSNVYFTRRVSVTWRCHHLDDLERLSYRFLTLNKLVYVEWGWAYPDEERTSFITPKNLKRISNPTRLRKDVIDKGKGNFDAVLGLIENFEWSSDGGGFECKTDIIAQGVDIFNQRINDDTQNVTRGNEIYRPGVTKYYNPDAMSKFDDFQSSMENKTFLDPEYDYSSEPSLTSTDEYNKRTSKKLGSDTVVSTEITQIPIGQYAETAISDKPYAQLGGIDAVELAYQKQQESEAQKKEELFSFTMDNLDILINEKLTKSSPSQTKNIYNKTIKANIAESDALLSEQKQKFQDLYDKINKEVTEEYDSENFLNWDNNSLVRSAGGDRARFRAINIETNRRFQQQNDGKSLKQKKKQVEKAYNENLVQRPVEIKSNIFYNKNFVQKVDEKRLPKYFKTIEVDEIEVDLDLKEEIKPPDYNSKQTWVRWGWFEDNILNRYFGRVNQDGEPILKIRSVRNEENNPVQEKIINHKDFLTPDINRFIFPGKFKLGLNSKEEQERNSDKIKKYEDSYSDNVELEYAKLFVEFDDVNYEIIRGAIALNPNITLDQLQDIIDTKDKDIPNIDDLKQTSEKLKFLILLEEVMSVGFEDTDGYETFTDEEIESPTEIQSFNSENENEGILRNVFINVSHLQEMFKEKTTLGVCVNRLLESFNGTTPLFNLIPVVNTKENEGHILFTEQRFTESFKPETQLQYEFPIKITESFVKSTNLASDISAEGTKILLSQQFANSPEPVIDKKTGASVSAQIEFDRLNKVDGKYTQFNKKLENGIEPFLYKGAYGLSSVKAYGQKQGDYTKPLAVGEGDSLSLAGLSFENLQKIKLRNEKNNNKENEKSTETSNNIRYAIDVPGNYTENGYLKSRKELQNTENLQGTRFKKSPNDEFGLLFLTNTMSLDGIAGITPGNIYTSQYLPDKFKDNCYFFIQNSSQTVDASTWTTEITGRVLFKYKTQSGVIGADNVLQARKDFEKNNSSRLDKTDSLSSNQTLFNIGK